VAASKNGSDTLASTTRGDDTLPQLSALAQNPSSRMKTDPFGDLGPGALINHSYRVIERLGEGGMGVVLLTRDLRLEREVAIKIIRPDYVFDEQSRKRFLTEARAMARVRHPNVVEIFAYGEVSGSPYFAMEYVEGPSLDRWVRKQGGPPIAPAQAFAVLDQVCQGVSAIHETGALHRDIKTTNILVGPGFRVVVADFGLARNIEHPESGEHGAVAGTPEFMAPELFGLAEQDPAFSARADVYALGVVAYELLTGRMPFDYTNLFTLVQKLATTTPHQPSRVRPDLPAAFDAPLLRALAKNPAERTPSAEAFRQELAEARASLSQRPPATEKARRILIADDDAEMRSLVRRMLRKALPNITIEEATDGALALAQAEATPPDIALIDLDMPGLNGIELTAALRERRTAEELPIVVMTGSGTPADWRLLSSLGASGILLKPIAQVQLVTLIRSLLRKEEEGLE